MNFDSQYTFYYFWLGVFVFTFSYYTLNVQLNHIFGLILFLVLLIYLVNENTTTTLIDNQSLEGKMNNLLPKEYNFQAEYLYLEPDFILLFDSIKKTFGTQNITSFYRIIKYTDEILGIRVKVEEKVCQAPTPPDILNGEIKYKPPICEQNYNSSFCMNMFFRARTLMNEIMNYSNTLILTSRLTPTTEWIYLRFVKRLGYLLKRTLNEIRNNCPQEEDLSEKIKFMSLDEAPLSQNFEWMAQN